MSESSNEQKDQSQKDDDEVGISDEQLPEDLQPSEDNPLAEPLTEEEAPDDIDDLDMMGGGSSDESDNEQDESDEQDEKAGDKESAGADGESADTDDED
jgi:hypothetical protein